MWNIPKVTGLLAQRVCHNIFRDVLRQQKPIFWMCTVATNANSNAIPDEIKYPNGDKRLKEYLDNLKEQQSNKNHFNEPVLTKVLQQYENRSSIVDQYTELAKEMAHETEKEIIALAAEERQRFSEQLAKIDSELIDRVILLTDDEPNVSSLMLEIQAGVGGQEAMLFARELAEMYENYIKFKRWPHNILEEDSTGIGGIRSFSIVVHGYDAYDALKNEAGVHRVQRIPKTERGGRIHTSTAVVLIVPCADDIDIKINPNDLRIETKRASGPGGQNVNKMESAVRIVHIPSGLAIECQEERTQAKNKQIAMKKLYSRLYQIEFTKQNSSQRNIRKSQTGTRTRNEKLRTYNYAQNRITDHRLSGGAGTTHNLDEFLAGTEHFDEFVTKINKFIQRQKLDDILNNNI